VPGLLNRIAPPRKVAVFRASRLGDFICATPAFRALRQALPQAEISFVGLPFIEPLATRLPSFDRFYAFPGAPGIAEQLFNARKLTAFFRRMQAIPFDLVIQIHGSGVFSNPIALMFGGRLTAGFIRAGDGTGHLDAACVYPNGLHEVKKTLFLTQFLGVPSEDERLDFPLAASDDKAAVLLLKRAMPPLIGVHARAEARTKKWRPERFAQAASRLAVDARGTVVLIGAGAEEGHLELVQGLRAPFVDLCGKTSLGVLGAVIKRLSVLLTNDSGPAHIAYALGIPSVTIFGSTLPSEWAPLETGRHRVVAHEVECRPCGLNTTCPIGFVCLEKVSVERVVEAGRQVMSPPKESGVWEANACSF